MRRWVASAVLAVCSAVHGHAETMPKDPAALDIADVFSHTCLHNDANPGRVAAWAKQQKLPALSATDARKALFADGPDGRAWYIHGPATDIYLAVQGESGTCAVFGVRADAGDFSRIYDEYLGFLAPRGTEIDRSPDRLQQGAFGVHADRSAAIHAPKGKLTTFAMTSDQKAGAPYQVSLSISVRAAAK